MSYGYNHIVGCFHYVGYYVLSTSNDQILQSKHNTSSLNSHIDTNTCFLSMVCQQIIMAHLTIKFQAQDGYIYELLHHVKANFQSRSITSFSPLHINMTRSEMMKYYNEIIPFIGKHLEYAERIQPKNEMFDPTSFPRLCTIIAVPIFRKLVLCNPNLQGQVDLYEDQTITKKTTSVSTVLLKLLNTLMPVKNIAKAAKGMVFCDLHDQLSLAQLTQTLLSPEEDLILAGQSREYYLTQGKQFYQEEMSIHLRKRLKEIYTAYPNATITRLATLKMGEFAYHVKMVIMKESVLIDLMLTMAILGHDQDWMQLIIEDCKSMESDTTKRWYASYDDQTLNLFLLAMLTQYVETYSVAANMRKVKDVIEQVISSVSQLASSGSQASQYATDTNDRTSKHKKRHEDKQKGTSEEAASNRFVSAKRKSINHELPWTKDEIIDILQYFDENKVPLHTLFANVGSLLSTINHEVHNEDLTEIINKLKALPANAHAQSFLSSEKARERIRKEDLKIDDVTQFCFGDNRSPLMYKEIYAHILLDRDIPQTAEEAPKAPVKKGFGALKESTARSNTLDDFIEIRDSLKAKFHPDQKLDELQYIAFQNSFSGIGIPYLHLFTMQYNVNVGILDSINLGLLDRLQRKLFPNDDE